MSSQERPEPIRRPSLLPAFDFEPLSSSPTRLPRATKRKFDEVARDDRQYYPTPLPTSSTDILPSSPFQRHARPAIQRSVSSLSERAPLGAVPSLEIPASGEPVLMGRSSNTSDYQLSSNRLISRVHVRATYHAPKEGRSEGEVVVECIGWNGCKIHYKGQAVELAKGETFVSDRPTAQIMVDVQDTRVLLLWPRKQLSDQPTRSPSLEDSPTKRFAVAVDRFASSPPPMCPRLRSPVSPSPVIPADATFASTFVADHSFSLDDEPPVQVYEDHESADESARCETPTPAVLLDPIAPRESSPAEEAVPPLESQSSGLSDPEELSENDEENDPIVHSFGPFGDNLLSNFESFKTASPDGRRKATLKLSFGSAQNSSEASTTRSFQESPIKNHVINQLAFSRVHSVPLSQIYSNLPSTMKAAQAVDDPSEEPALTHSEFKTMLSRIPCVGEIPREGKDAAGKPLENEWYYVPEMDTDELRRATVSGSKPPLRNVRKSHKQYYWKKPRV